METRALAPLYFYTTPTAAGTLTASVTVTANAATATASAQLTGASVAQLQIANKTSAWAHVNFGVFGAVIAATVAAGYPVAPGAVVVVSVATEVTGASVILDAAPTGSASVIFSRGEGL